MELPFQHLARRKINVDRVIVLSDNQCNSPYHGGTIQECAAEYRSQTNPDCWVHGVDLQGYGTVQFYGRRTNIVAGWSEKLLEFITLAESGTDTLIKRIDAVDIQR